MTRYSGYLNKRCVQRKERKGGKVKERRWKVRLRPASKSLKSSVNMFIVHPGRNRKARQIFKQKI